MIRRTRLARALSPALLAVLGVLLAVASAPAGDRAPRLTGVVNVNTATVDQLRLLPGIGEARARAVIATRETLGGFETVEQLLEVKGIGPGALARLRPFVRLTGKTTARVP